MMEQQDEETNYSIELQEILGTIPKWIIRYGLSTLFLILASGLVGSYFFSLPEIISVPITLTTVNPPTPLISKVSGRIEILFVNNDDTVRKGAFIALLQNSANVNHVLKVKETIERYSGNWYEYVKSVSLPKNVELGEIQSAYSNYCSTFEDFNFYLNTNNLDEKINIQEKKISYALEILTNMTSQQLIKKESFKITEQNFKTDSNFFIINKYGIPKREFDITRQSFLNEKESFIAFEGAIKNYQSSILKLKEELMLMKESHESRLLDYCNDLNEDHQSLTISLMNWLETYIVQAPIDGRVTFTNFWSVNQFIKVGERIASIVPSDNYKVIGRATVQASSLVKIEPNQEVRIKLSGFPYLKYGVLKGKVRNVSLVPEDKIYVAEIELLDGMISNYNEQLKFVHEMDGFAEIVTQENRLIYKLIDPLKYLFTN